MWIYLDFLAVLSTAYSLFYFLAHIVQLLLEYVVRLYRRHRYGDQTVRIQDLLAAAGYPIVQSCGVGRHRRETVSDWEIFTGVNFVRTVRRRVQMATRPPRHAADKATRQRQRRHRQVV